MILESDYPELLRGALEHADALSRTLAEPAVMVRLDRWAIGRSEEIARFVELVVGDWRLGALSEKAAAEELESYVRTLEGALHECVTARDALGPVPPRSPLARRTGARGT